MAKKKQDRRLAVFDFETDPFLNGRIPQPFSAGFFDGETRRIFWGDDCAAQLITYLETREPLILYAHNGGKFDFHYLLADLENPVKIINGRITEARLRGHVIRDSFAIIPLPLSAYQKDDIDYALFERNRREKHRAEIESYLMADCVYLYKLVAAFRDRFGDNLTIGGTAIKTLAKIHPFATCNEQHDARFREYYFGGRVQAFKTGIIKGVYKVFDVNSMYPHAMRNYSHPTGRLYAEPTKPQLTDAGKIRGFKSDFFFVKVRGINRGAFPIRTKEGLDFETERGEYFTTSHELRTALQHGLFIIEKITGASIPHKTIRFADYVDTFIAEKIAGKKTGDKVREIFAKLLLNSAYGKFAQNPEHYYDWRICGPDTDWREIHAEQWEPYADHGAISIWRKPTKRHAYYDVAIAASITSASRSILLDALALAKSPIYCDTDSIICAELDAKKDDYELGAWKLEATADRCAIAGKKLYALFDGDECVKTATKGVRLEPADIVRLCRGESVEWASAAPTFSMFAGPRFVSRKIAGLKNF